MNKKTNESLKKKIARKEKEKEKGKEKQRKFVTLYLETQARSEGYMAKVFKIRCPKPTGWESPTLLLITWVDG